MNNKAALSTKDLGNWPKSFSFWLLIAFTFMLLVCDMLVMHSYICTDHSHYKTYPSHYFELLILMHLLPILLVAMRLFLLDKSHWVFSCKKLDAMGVSYCLITMVILFTYFLAFESHLWFSSTAQKGSLLMYLVSITFAICIILIIISDYIEYHLYYRFKKRG